MTKCDILKLPVCINSYIVLRREVRKCWDADVIQKFIQDYYDVIPVCDWNDLFVEAVGKMDNRTFQTVLASLWRVR